MSFSDNPVPAALRNQHDYPTMSHVERRNDDPAIPVAWVSREDLTDSRPDLADTIANMSDSEVEIIAKMVSDSLQEDVQLAIFTALNYHFEDTQDGATP